MATTIAISNLNVWTLAASTSSIPFLAVDDPTQSMGGSVDRITIADLFGATQRLPVGIYQALGTVTVSTPATDSIVTWNAGGVTFTHIKANITNTASAAASKLIDLQVGGVSQFSVGVAGAVAVLGDLAIATNKFTVASATGNTAIAGTATVTGATTLVSDVRAGTTTGTLESGRGSGSATQGDLFVSPTDKTVYVGRQSPASGDNSQFIVQSRTGAVVFHADATNVRTILGSMATTNASSGNFCLTNGTAPTGNPSGGGFMWSESGAGKWRGSSGTTTTFGPADPHCPSCGRDFMTEHDNATTGYLAVCLSCLADELGDRPWILRQKSH